MYPIISIDNPNADPESSKPTFAVGVGRWYGKGGALKAPVAPRSPPSPIWAILAHGCRGCVPHQLPSPVMSQLCVGSIGTPYTLSKKATENKSQSKAPLSRTQSHLPSLRCTEHEICSGYYRIESNKEYRHRTVADFVGRLTQRPLTVVACP